MSLLENVLSSVIANFVFWIGLGVAFAIALRAGQRRLRRFFGLANGKTLHICLSNLWNPTVLPASRVGKARYLIGLNELEASRAIDSLFTTANFRLPDMVRGLVDSMWSSNTKRAETSIAPPIGGPGGEYEYLDEPLIVIGGARWNSVRRHFIATNELSMQFSSEEAPSVPATPGVPPVVQVKRGVGAGDISHDRLALAVLEKRRTGTARSVTFFCTGARGDLSRATTEYLIRNWRKLYHEFREDDFALCLGFPNEADGSLSKYVDPVVLRRSS